MSLLISGELLKCISDELGAVTESTLIISAFCKVSMIKHFDACITNPGIDKTLIVRFRPEDIVSGASDLELYPYCKDNGWKLFFRLDLHAKTYVFDNFKCIIGSANATGKGMKLNGTGNYEMAAAFQLDAKDKNVLRNLLVGSVEMNDSIYNEMGEFINKSKSVNPKTLTWPDSISELFHSDYSVLFSEDFPSCSHPADAENDDLIFLNLGKSALESELVSAFTQSKCYLWLLNTVRKSPKKELSFGALSQYLHSAILNEPKPYRKDVKILLSNLITWVIDLKINELILERPRYSQCVKYRNGGI